MSVYEYILPLQGYLSMRMFEQYQKDKKRDLKTLMAGLMEQFPVNYYSEFLIFVKENYEGKYWNALPKDVAAYYKNTVTMI